MKKLTIFFAFLVLTVSPSLAMDDAKCPVNAPPVSKDLEQIKSLAGKWEGTTLDEKGKSQQVTVEYHVTSGGSAVVETLSPGTPHEMVSVYHDKNGKLSMTHYCMLGNQPEMDLLSSAGQKMSFGAGETLKGQFHMHSLMLDNSEPSKLVQTWTSESPDDKPIPPTVITLKKVS